MGYKSAFGLMPYLRADPQPDDGNPLKQLRKQDLFTYQTINFYNLGVMLTEGGFWMYSSIGNYKSGIDLDLEEWVQIFVPTAQDTLYLWTRCVMIIPSTFIIREILRFMSSLIMVKFNNGRPSLIQH